MKTINKIVREPTFSRFLDVAVGYTFVVQGRLWMKTSNNTGWAVNSGVGTKAFDPYQNVEIPERLEVVM